MTSSAVSADPQAAGRTAMFRVAVIGGQPHAVRAAKEHDIEVVLVHEEGRYEDTFTEYCGRIMHAPITDSDAILAALRPLHEQRPFDRVLSTSEDGAAATGYVVEALGLPGNPARTSELLKNKVLTRKTLADNGFDPVRYQLVRDEAELQAFHESVGERIVVKPVDGVASANVHVVTGPAEAAVAWRKLTEAGCREALAEEYLDGPAISVESFSSAGRHLPIAITEYQLNEHFVEVGISVPSRVAVPWQRELRELTVRLLDAVGLVDGPSHTEFVLTRNGPRVLESHNRLAGGGVPELVCRAYGVSLSELFLTVPLGLAKLPDEAPAPTGGAAIKFFEPEPGVVTGFDGLDELDAPLLRLAPGVRIPGIPRLRELEDAEVGVLIQVNEGDEIPVIRAGWDRRMGYVIVTGRDGDDAVTRAADTARRVRFRRA